MEPKTSLRITDTLAIDRAFQGKGLGVALLQDAVLRAQQAASVMGIRGLLVHAISEDVRAFYAHHGFISSISNPLTLILSLAVGQATG